MASPIVELSWKTTPLFMTFNKAAELISGTPATEFYFSEKAPMGTLTQTLVGMAIYYTVVLGGRELMRNRPAFKLNLPFKIHNFYLTAISGGLLALHLEQLIPTVMRVGVYSSVCHKQSGWTQSLAVLYYLNYLTKYLEFIDTVFLVLRKKPLTFLHTYHHGATALLCYLQMAGETPVSWVCIVANLSVHCLMYYYYFQSARGIKIWWKQYITSLQIAQFVVDLSFIYYLSYGILVAKHMPWAPQTAEICDGSDSAALSGTVIITSYLFLFISFYFATYAKKPAQVGKAQRRQSKGGHRVSVSGAEAALGNLRRVNTRRLEL